MATPPILEVYVVWHPDDTVGGKVSSALIHHFHGPAYAGLAGGAVSVYVRSHGWTELSAPPRPMPFMQDLPGGLHAAQFTAVVPVLGRHMARAVREDERWSAYMQRIFDADLAGGRIAVVPIRDALADITGTNLATIAVRQQALTFTSTTSDASLSREVAQAFTQRLRGAPDDRITVFLSHTKHSKSARDLGPQLVEEVREVLQDTHLDTFFDAQDIQASDDWAAVLDEEATRHALLMIRTDAYASREWTQREVLNAKEHDLPVVALYAVRDEEERGSFLMDHVPVVACPEGNHKAAIEHALNRLVDEALKRALWKNQEIYLKQDGFDWLPVHAPEPVTLTAWLRKYRTEGGKEDPHIFIIHPDPPLGPRERKVVIDICELAGFTERVDILTPRTFANRGGTLNT